MRRMSRGFKSIGSFKSILKTCMGDQGIPPLMWYIVSFGAQEKAPFKWHDMRLPFLIRHR